MSVDKTNKSETIKVPIVLEIPIRDDQRTDSPWKIANQYPSCFHSYVLVDKHEKTVTCREEGCGYVWGHWEYIAFLAGKGSRVFEDMDAARAETRKLQGELEELKRQTRNAKAALKRAVGQGSLF